MIYSWLTFQVTITQNHMSLNSLPTHPHLYRFNSKYKNTPLNQRSNALKTSGVEKYNGPRSIWVCCLLRCSQVQDQQFGGCVHSVTAVLPGPGPAVWGLCLIQWSNTWPAGFIYCSFEDTSPMVSVSCVFVMFYFYKSILLAFQAIANGRLYFNGNMNYRIFGNVNCLCLVDFSHWPAEEKMQLLVWVKIGKY